MMKRSKWLLNMALAIVLALSFAAYAQADDSIFCSDVIAGIDHASVIINGDTTFFSSIMVDGTEVRFEGTNISIDADGITMRPESSITSLDAVGQIHAYQACMKDGDQATIGAQWLDVGYGYTNAADKTSVERAAYVYADALMGYLVAEWNAGSILSMEDFLPNFVFVKSTGGNTEDFTVTSLIIEYDPSERYTNIEIAKQVLPEHFAGFDVYFASIDAAYVESNEVAQAETVEAVEIAAMEMQAINPDTVCSDIVAGIDLSSVAVEGNTTFFNSVMSDGTVVRFEGTNISIDASGITLFPQSTIISLDAVGSVYAYQLAVKDGNAASISNQWLDIGYGYVNTADKTSVERAEYIFAGPYLSSPVATWNEPGSLSVADILPNFVYVKGADGNSEAVTLTGLMIEYNPEQKYTDIQIAEQALPGYFSSFDSYFEVMDAIYAEAHATASDAENASWQTTQGGRICSDIIAGIDLSSIYLEDGATFFSSIMSDGTVVRFEGTGISIDADGILMQPESSLISLDAIGQIHSYQASIANGEQAPASEQMLDIGCGYTLSPNHIHMGRASSIFTSSCYGYPASAWNQGGIIFMEEYLPNFVFVSSLSSNTEEFLLTSLTIDYDSSQTYTDIETIKETLPAALYAELRTEADVIQNVLGAQPVADNYIDINTLAEMKVEESGGLYSDVVAGIDLDSVRVEGNTTFFSSTMSDGAVIRFEGTNIVVGADGITLNPESRVYSLDAVGTIYLYRAAIKDGASENIAKQLMDVGGGYTFDPAKTSVGRASELSANATASYSAREWNDGCIISMIAFEPNFVFFDGGHLNSAQITVESLIIGYAPDEKYTDSSFISDYLTLYFPAIATASSSAERVTDSAAETAQGVMCVSDIIAGIDHSSISVSGERTFFSSIMSDGTAIRFEGKNISIGAEGITMNPGSSLTSLDALGGIYEYFAVAQESAAMSEQWMSVGYGYTFSAEKTSVERAEEVRTSSLYGVGTSIWAEGYRCSVAAYQPNFVYVNAANFNSDAFTLTSLTVGYDPAQKVTAIIDAKLLPFYYGEYLEGEPYNLAKESKADEEAKVYDFYLLLKQDVQGEADMENTENWLYFLPASFYTVGDLKDADGNVLDKETARVQAGYTLDVTIGDYALTVELPMAERYAGAQTFEEARPYSTLTATGEQHTLVVPVVWADQTDLVCDEVYALYQKALGTLIDEQGNLIGDYSDAEDEVFSLTEYFNIASYGQFEIFSFLTDWYYTDKTFADTYEYIFPEVEFAAEVLNWVKASYPETDWTQFDQDGDGVVDSIVLISVGLSQYEGYTPASFGGAVHSTGSSYGKLAGTQADPQANCFLTVNHSFLMDGETNALIHEFSHNFGLNDYYDGTGNGIDAVGEYDMQGSNIGDWNAYSKLAVGWMEPQVVSGLASGESVELTIGSSALTGDVIVLPAAGTAYDGPFGEYVMIDLLSPDGVNAYDAAQYGLENTVGVRISHVNANLKRTTESDSVLKGYLEDNGNVIGMELYDNNYSDDGLGIYNIEVIQSGGVNTFTNLDNLYPMLRAKDLFYAGDTFAAEDYSQFFYDGLMDNGMALGYSVKILSIGTDADGAPIATIRITAN